MLVSLYMSTSDASGANLRSGTISVQFMVHDEWSSPELLLPAETRVDRLETVSNTFSMSRIPQRVRVSL